VYSLGFIVWSVAICGRNPFEELQELFGETNSTEDRVGMFNFLKDSNEILEIAIAHVTDHAGDLLGDVLKCCTYLSQTLQLDPAQRSLILLLEGLRKESYRRDNEHITLSIQFAPLVPFDIQKVSRATNHAPPCHMSTNTAMKIKINHLYFRAAFLPHMALDEILQELELLASGKTHGGYGEIVGSDPNVIWRFPWDHCVRQAAAAFALSHARLYHPDVQNSIDSSLHWLSKAARNGLTIAKALCGRLSNMPATQISLQEELEWLRSAARIGSRIALAQLKEQDKAIYNRYFEEFCTDFWAGVYTIPDI
jgi:hypothetical protein